MLKLIPKRQPNAHEKAALHIKTMPCTENLFQCPHCGGRTEIKEVTGSYMRDGKKHQGTVIHRGICSMCYKYGSVVDMTPIPNLLCQGKH